MKRKLVTVIDRCSNDLSPMDKRFLDEYQELRGDDVTGNGCYLEVYRKHRIWVDKAFYPAALNGLYLSESATFATKEQLDSLNEMMEDFFTRNKIEGDSFLFYVSW